MAASLDGIQDLMESNLKGILISNPNNPNIHYVALSSTMDVTIQIWVAIDEC